MKRFKTYIFEANLQRRIFNEPLSDANQIYDQITTRNNRQFVNTPEFQARNQEYKRLNRSPLQKEGDDEGAWNYYEVNREKKRETKTNSAPNKLGYTFKRYYSVAGVENPDVARKFASAMPDLHQRLESIGQHFGQGFSAKIPSNPHTLETHTDSLVIHHYDMPDSSLTRSIHATVQKWAGDHGIEFLNRQGTDEGVDHSQHGTFSQQLANKIGSGEKGSISEIGKNIVNGAIQHIRTNAT